MIRYDAITPTVGRMVWYFDESQQRRRQPLAALVTYVWNDHEVNLAVFSVNGHSFSRQNVPLRQPCDEDWTGAHCEWMPYPIGQAKKRCG